jgi:hypothetical protein
MLGDIDLVGAVLDEPGCELFDVVAQEQSGQFHMESVGEPATLTHQLKRGFLQFARVLFGKDPNLTISIYVNHASFLVVRIS